MIDCRLLLFESDVILNTTKTLIKILNIVAMFESDVILNTTKTSAQKGV